MEIRQLETRADRAKFCKFRAELYAGDECYVCTDKFVLYDVLYDGTAFARSCKKLPLQVTEGGKVLAQAILIKSDNLPYVQLAFFDALPGCQPAAELLKDRARQWCRQLGAKGAIAGLNAHLSYSVGILADGFDYKASFDSPYNKDYYAAYFADCAADGLTVYRGRIDETERHFPAVKTDRVRVRYCRMDRFAEETELMRRLCEQTIAHTHLYSPTRPRHFYELLRALKPFLRPHNLLFAEDAQGRAVGFLLWHPDFNQMLKGGKNYTICGIALRWLLHRGDIDTAKVNALGSLSYAATYALIDAFRRLVRGKYDYVETSFVWDNNVRSSLLMKRLFSRGVKKYEVYYL